MASTQSAIAISFYLFMQFVLDVYVKSPNVSVMYLSYLSINAVM